MSADPAETVILCEGYHDRAFWSGLLEDAGFRDARPKRDDGSMGHAIDPFEKRVAAGDFAFLSLANDFVRVRPCHGASKVPARMRDRLAQRATQRVEHLIVNLDTDASDETCDLFTRDSILRTIHDRIRSISPHFVQADDGDLLIDHGETRISVVLWSAPEPPSRELPERQTLERLVCAALRDAHPERAQAVAAWLDARPSPSPSCSKSYKAHAWLHMGAWYPEHGCDDFYRNLWRSAQPVSEKLRQRVHALLPASVTERLRLRPLLTR